MLIGNILFYVVCTAMAVTVVTGICAGVCYLSELFFGANDENN